MKKIMICFIPMLFLAIGIISCQKEELVDGKIRVRLEHCHNKDLKVSFDMANGFQWQGDDQIKVCRVNKTNANQVLIATYTIDESSVTNQSDYADFSFTSGTTLTSSNSTGDYYAYYPASIRGTQAGITYNAKIVIPNLQSISSDGKMQGFPMYAQMDAGATDLNLSFKNLCGILRLHLTGGENDLISSITVTTDQSHPIVGSFTMQDANTQAPFITAMPVGPSVGSAGYSITVSCPSTGLDISGAGRDFCIYLPTGDYPHLEITIVRSDGKECKKVFDANGSKDAPTAINIARSCYTSVSFSNLAFKTVHAFSVTASNKVLFSQGNLQYDINNSRYQFAGNDYTYIGADNATNLTNGSGVIDLFGWGTGNNPTLNSLDNDDYPTTFDDWGNYQIWSSDGNDTYVAGSWRTLTKDEWTYLLNTRSASPIGGITSARYAKAKVCGIYGLIIFPDVFELPTGISVIGVNATGSAGWDGNDYNATEWAALKEAGAIFLPAAGYMSDSQDDRRPYTGDNSEGDYWYTTLNSNSQGEYRRINRPYLSDRAKPRKSGCSVRLVQDY